MICNSVRLPNVLQYPGISIVWRHRKKATTVSAMHHLLAHGKGGQPQEARRSRRGGNIDKFGAAGISPAGLDIAPDGSGQPVPFSPSQLPAGSWTPPPPLGESAEIKLGPPCKAGLEQKISGVKCPNSFKSGIKKRSKNDVYFIHACSTARLCQRLTSGSTMDACTP